MGRDGVLEPLPELDVVIAQIGRRQLVFRRKAAIEARLRHPGAADDLVDPDGPDAFPVERFDRLVDEADGIHNEREPVSLALGALDSGRWKVEPETDELISEGEEPKPIERPGLVGELRTRDWITADGEVTFLGRAALRRWQKSTTPS